MSVRLLAFAALAAVSLACRTGKQGGELPAETDTGGLQIVDADGDGFGADEDCDDDDASVHPSATEVCDGVDNDCDGDVDDGVLISWYRDADGDGAGDATRSVEACQGPAEYVTDGNDCDDLDPQTYPSAPERCDDADNDCDGEIDEDIVGVWYADADGDGYGDPDASLDSCDPPDGWVQEATDCDDLAAAAHPGADEVCDGLDNDCDGIVDNDDALDAGTWYADADGDGYGDGATTTRACDPPTGFVADATDCDDANIDVSPLGVERCNSIDDDCDGAIDEADAIDPTIWYADTDHDGYGDPASSTAACDQPSGFTADDSDCDDGDGAVHPGAAELCNSIDDDCDGTTDPDTATDAGTWYADSDGDGYGDSAPSTVACDQPSGFSATDDDCDDSAAAVNPGATEVCNSIDDDCDGATDPDTATDALTWYADDDCDGFGDAATTTTACDQPSGFTDDDSDCDDAEPTSNPGAPEICNTADSDCDGTADNACDNPIDIDPPSEPVLASVDHPAGCALLGEVSAVANPHYSANLTTFMSALDGGSGFVASTAEDLDVFDYSARCGSYYASNTGHFNSTTSWPVLSSTGTYGAARFRGYIHIGCGDGLSYTMGLIGNDSVTLSIEGAEIMTVNWDDGQWQKFRYVTFPEPGLYAYEVQWSTNLTCSLDPFELVWADGFVAGYDDYDGLCAYSSCGYSQGVSIPGFSVITGDSLSQSTDGTATSCAQCSSSADCATGEICNTAGLCE